MRGNRRDAAVSHARQKTWPKVPTHPRAAVDWTVGREQPSMSIISISASQAASTHFGIATREHHHHPGAWIPGCSRSSSGRNRFHSPVAAVLLCSGLLPSRAFPDMVPSKRPMRNGARGQMPDGVLGFGSDNFTWTAESGSDKFLQLSALAPDLGEPITTAWGHDVSCRSEGVFSAVASDDDSTPDES